MELNDSIYNFPMWFLETDTLKKTRHLKQHQYLN